MATIASPHFSAQLAGAASLGAALVHAAAAGAHGDDRTLVLLFTATAAAQAAAGLALLRSPGRGVLVAAAGTNLAAAAAWAASRLTGLPLVESLSARQPAGLQDATAAALGTAAALLAIASVRRPTDSSPARPMWWPALALPLAMVGVAAPHSHDDGPVGADHHDHEVAAAADHDHQAEADDHPDHGDGDGLSPVDAVLAGADTSDATPSQLEAAVALVTDTRDALDGLYARPADAEAAGFVWIGDGRRVGGFQHYVHHGRLSDGKVLDPAAVESLVYEHTADGPVLVSAMYLLEPGSTIEDAPEVAGGLTVWHDHQNLCWDPGGTRLAGVLVDGRCQPGGELRATSPMLHVWLEDHECGPFAGIEGHGEGCAAHDH